MHKFFRFIFDVFYVIINLILLILFFLFFCFFIIIRINNIEVDLPLNSTTPSYFIYSYIILLSLSLIVLLASAIIRGFNISFKGNSKITFKTNI